jgi:long-subunit fatty acid transport protein
MNRAFPYALWILLASAAYPNQTPASPLEINEFEARAAAMAGAQTAVVNDYTAVLYNPGALTRARRLTTGFGIVQTVPKLQINPLGEAPDQAKQPIFPTNRTGMTFGASFPLGEYIQNRVVLGLGIYTPTAYTLRGEMRSPQTPQFYRYQNRPDRFVGLGAMALRLTEWLSMGVGFQLFADLIGRVAIDLRLSDRQITGQSVRVDFPLKLTPTAGLLLGPFNNFRLGLSWKRSTQLKFEIPSTLILDETIALQFKVGGVVLYTPETFNLGLAYEDATRGTVLTIGTTWARWSNAPDPSLRIAVDAQGQLLESLGIEERLDLRGSQAVDLAFRDIWVLRAAVEQRVAKRWRLRSGYAFRPGPAPIPTGAYNYLDPASHRIGVGLGLGFHPIPHSDHHSIQLDLAYSATILAENSIIQQAGPSDPVGDYTAGGTMHGFTFTFRRRF